MSVYFITIYISWITLVLIIQFAKYISNLDITIYSHKPPEYNVLTLNCSISLLLSSKNVVDPDQPSRNIMIPNPL